MHVGIIESIPVQISGFYWGFSKQSPPQESHHTFFLDEHFLMKAHRDGHPHKTTGNNEIGIKKLCGEKMWQLEEKEARQSKKKNKKVYEKDEHI